MYLHRKGLMLCLLASTLLIHSCDLLEKDSDPEPIYEPGFGASDERPVGTPFSWPAGLILFEQSTDQECVEEAEKNKRFYGIGSLVAVCLIFQNLTDKPITLELPPGLIWISESVKIQNGLLVKKVSLEVPAKARYHAYLNLFCINGGRGGSSGSAKYEDVPIISNHQGMKQLYELLAPKKINYEQYGGGYNTAIIDYSIIIANAVNELRQGDPIKDRDLKRIAALPNE